MKKFLYGIIGVLALVVAIAACSDSSTEKVDSVEKKEETRSTPKEEPKEKLDDEIYNIGDTVGLNTGAEFTIVSAEHVNGNEYVKPEKGKVLKLHVKVVNNGTQQVGVYSGMFNLYDANGSQFKEYFGDGSPISGDLNKGKQVEGDIWYDVDGSGKYELVLKPNSAQELEIKFNIQL
ncbi:DUF4352 domain-containing protein [Bacillus thuringiensis]|uniref:DUF4352 domain-containing protein n=1 Tax=Bacillus cereus group TaxID=86661 RepID=UPI000CD8E231|nr:MULTISPECIES: DUF4352 domain-containing protein [Bacillus cereus group]MEC3420527.1 DUF4352 domain-containing protein [Bacillus cereus]MEC3596937.1 DUF4352 domain-containing protein [Bacillus thuringiensis]MED1574286.1 DUF4352 domain-containing protein [Bacillus paranthracis]MED1836210.1 DUF4352 domain-containing protein [Bacillus thuringiensis]MED2670273.1 DUF4352 domain-containing protein [Bacillus thuringiensis]